MTQRGEAALRIARMADPRSQIQPVIKKEGAQNSSHPEQSAKTDRGYSHDGLRARSYFGAFHGVSTAAVLALPTGKTRDPGDRRLLISPLRRPGPQLSPRLRQPPVNASISSLIFALA